MIDPKRSTGPLVGALLLATACSGGGGTDVLSGAGTVDHSLPPVSDSPVEGRVIVVVVPGVDPDLVERWRSDLPGFERFTPGRNMPRLAVDPPADLGHAAAQLATGLRGGASGALGGARVDPTDMSIRSSAVAPGVEPFWVTAARAGVPTRALWVPGDLPAEPIRGLWVLPESLAAAQPARSLALLSPGATLLPGADLDLALTLEGDPPWTAEIPLQEGLTWSFEISQPRPGAYRLSTGPTHADLTVGEVGAPVTLTLPDGASPPAVQVRLAATASGKGVIFSILCPGRVAGPDQPVTSPPGFADDWARFNEPVDTTGGAAVVLEALRAGLVSSDALVRELEAQGAARSKALAGELGRRDARLVVAWLPEAGLAGRAFLGLADSGHPGWSGERASSHGGAAKSAVARLDAALVALRSSLLPGDRLLVVSDVGVTSRRTHVDLNAALADAGLLALHSGTVRDAAPTLERAARWAGTSAYATGPGYVSLNLAGRESQGIVTSRRAARELARVTGLLSALRDGKNRVVASIQTGEEAFPDAPHGVRPDLVVHFADGYGPAPIMVAGRVGPAAVVPNRSGVTGAVGGADPADAAGFAVTTFGEVDSDAHVADLAPTVLRLLGVAEPAELHGKVWSLAGEAVAPVEAAPMDSAPVDSPPDQAPASP